MRYLSYIPCRYSRFVFLSGVCIAFGLLLTSLLLTLAAPKAFTTSQHLHYINTGKSCIESAFAVLVCALAAASIGEAVFRNHPE